MILILFTTSLLIMQNHIYETHDLESLFDNYDLVFSFSDNGDVLECIVDNFYVFLRDKFGF